MCLYNLNKITICLQNKITSAGNDIKNSLENLFLINVLIIRLQENWCIMTMIYSCRWYCLLNLTCIIFSFQIIGRFKVEYYKFSSWFHIETCIDFTKLTFENKQIYKSLFDNVTCGKENMELRYSIRRNLYNISIHLHCNNTSEVHNVTRSTDGKVELYCGKPYFLFHFPCLNKRNNNDLTLQQWRDPTSKLQVFFCVSWDGFGCVNNLRLLQVYFLFPFDLLC